MNLENKQDKTLIDSLELLGLLDNSEDECLSTQFECKHDTRAFHCHSLKETRLKQQGKTQARRRLLITCAVCLIFMIGEVIEVLGALLSVLSIWTVTVVLVLFAVQRLISDDYEIHSDIMMITAACAVVLNIFLAFILHQSPVRHSHSHGLTEEHSNTSVRAAFIHVLGDLLQSLGVLLAATIIYFRDLFTSPLLFFILLNVLESACSDEQTNPQTVLMDMTRLLQTEYGFSSITIQTETHTDDGAHCLQCQDPMD
ncbi:hypothetical protein cypCar_00007815 [Cyprinus carpio]|nr:hypothetical protein cypCar_00007815 [Cyprinus carpio]